MTNTFTWFQKFLAVLWISTLMLLSFGSSSSSVATGRFLDASTGILRTEVSQAMATHRQNIVAGIMAGTIAIEAAGPVIIIGDIVKRIMLHLFASILKWILNKISQLIDKALDLIQKYADVLTNLASSLSPVFAALTIATKNDAARCSQITSFIGNQVNRFLSYSPKSPMEYGFFNLGKQLSQVPAIGFASQIFASAGNTINSALVNTLIAPKPALADSFVNSSDFKDILSNSVTQSLADPSICKRPIQDMGAKYANKAGNSVTDMPAKVIDTIDILANNSVIGVENGEASKYLENTLKNSVTDFQASQTANADNFCTASLPLSDLFGGGCSVVVTNSNEIGAKLTAIGTQTGNVVGPKRQEMNKITTSSELTPIISDTPCNTNQLQDAIQYNDPSNPPQLGIGIANASNVNPNQSLGFFGSVNVEAGAPPIAAGANITVCYAPRFTQKDVSDQRVKTAANAITGPNSSGESDTSLSSILQDFFSKLQDLVNKGIQKLTDILNKTINKITSGLNLNQLDFTNIFGLLGAGSSILDKGLSQDLNNTYNNFNNNVSQGVVLAQIYPSDEGGIPTNDPDAANFAGFQFITDRSLSFTFTPSVTVTNTDYRITQVNGQNISPGQTITFNNNRNSPYSDWVRVVQVRLESDGKTLTATRQDPGWIQTAQFTYTVTNNNDATNSNTQDIKLVWFKN